MLEDVGLKPFDRGERDQWQFGFNLPWWDRLIGTYRVAPAAGHEGMTIGLDTFRDPAQLRLDRMLVQPFLGAVGAYPINRRRVAP